MPSVCLSTWAESQRVRGVTWKGRRCDGPEEAGPADCAQVRLVGPSGGRCAGAERRAPKGSERRCRGSVSGSVSSGSARAQRLGRRPSRAKTCESTCASPPSRGHGARRSARPGPVSQHLLLSYVGHTWAPLRFPSLHVRTGKRTLRLRTPPSASRRKPWANDRLVALLLLWLQPLTPSLREGGREERKTLHAPTTRGAQVPAHTHHHLPQ